MPKRRDRKEYHRRWYQALRADPERYEAKKERDRVNQRERYRRRVLAKADEKQAKGD